jgi:hypothetical protein
MRITSTLIGLTTLFALGSGSARAQTPAAAVPAGQPVAVAPSPEPAAPSAPAVRKLHVGLSFLPMGMGKYIYSPDTMSTVKSNAAFAYGFGLSVGYEILPRLVVGVAPQAVFNVKEKEPEIASNPVREYDLLARVAYVMPVVEGTSIYAEVLPGYSVIMNDAGAKGVVVAFGLGANIDLGERVFVSLAAGYQLGFQSWSEGTNTFQTRTRFVRMAIGGGVRF